MSEIDTMETVLKCEKIIRDDCKKNFPLVFDEDEDEDDTQLAGLFVRSILGVLATKIIYEISPKKSIDYRSNMKILQNDIDKLVNDVCKKLIGEKE